MAKAGADVIKIEPQGEPLRRRASPPPRSVTSSSRSISDGANEAGFGGIASARRHAVLNGSPQRR